MSIEFKNALKVSTGI